MTIGFSTLTKGLVGHWSLSQEDTIPTITLSDDFSTDTTSYYATISSATKSYESSDFMRVTDTTGAVLGVYKNNLLVAGQTYRVSFKAKGTRLSAFASIGDNGSVGTAISNPVINGSWQDYEFIITPTQVLMRWVCNYRFYWRVL